jgi:60 kDa SS-A/Ro ribonucleoprotein
MSNAFTRNLASPVPQTKAASPEQVKNNAGGYSFEVSDADRLERFLILGTDGGTYYVSEHDLTKQNVDWLIRHISLRADGGLGVLEKVVEVSESGRAYRNSAAIFVLALLFKHGPTAIKPLLILALPKVCRTSTHLYEFAEYNKLLTNTGKGGWNRTKRAAVAAWYQSKTDDQLAYQAVKYRQRNGWTHRDMFRLSHPEGVNPKVGNFILKGEVDLVESPNVLVGFQVAQDSQTVEDVLQALEAFKKLPWEALPTQFLKEVKVWQKLFYNNQLNGQALLRNVTRLAKLGAFKDMVFARQFADKLVDEEMIRKTRLHPIQYLLALVNYTEGQVDRKRYGLYGMRSKDWTVNPVIRDALDAGFYLAFKYADSADKKTLIGLDVSGSMSSLAMGIDLSCAEVGAAMSMATVRREPYYQVMGFAHVFKDLGITPKMSLQQVLAITRRQNFGGTDCSLPMTWAKEQGVDVDTFVVMTDNETWAGKVHPHVALEQYRQHVGHDAKLIVAGMASNGFTIANPKDRGMLDVVGADASLPKLVADFSAGRI